MSAIHNNCHEQLYSNIELEKSVIILFYALYNMKHKGAYEY